MTGDTHLSDGDLQDAAGHRLSAERAGVVERHLEACRRCRDLVATHRGTVSRIVRAAGVSSAPASLRASIASALDAEDASMRRRRPRGWLLAAAAATLLAAAGWWLLGGTREPLTRSVAADYRALESNELELALRSADAQEVERFFSGRRLDFETRVFDLGMMGYGLAGARAHRVGDEPSALIAYRARDGSWLLCEMFRGRLSSLPPARGRLSKGGTEFRLYESQGLTLVFWPEGEVLCVLAGRGPSNAILELAFAKARLASG